VFNETGEAEVTQTGIEVPVKHNVAGLNVSMNDPLLPFFVKIQQR
jgi:hypothetical protein